MVQNPVWIVPAPFCTTHHVNDGRYILRCEVPEDEKQGKERKNDVDVRQIRSLYSGTCFKSCKLLAVGLLRNSKYDEKICKA